MRRALKWIGISIGILLLVLVLTSAVLYVMGSSRLNESYTIEVESISVPGGEAAVDRGRHLSEAVTLCQACHGDNLEGGVIDDEPLIAKITASNLTSGQGGVADTYTDEDWIRAIRHGINPQGRGLIIMHSDVYHNLSEEDLGSIIAYAKSALPVDNKLPDTKAEPLGRILVALGMFDIEGMPLIPAEAIDHSAPFTPMPTEDKSAEYGRYLTSITVCTMCHGRDYKGRASLEPGAPPAPDITTDGELKGVSEQAFIDHFRSHAMEEEEYMPWKVYANMTDDELGAIWLHLQSPSGS